MKDVSYKIDRVRDQVSDQVWVQVSAQVHNQVFDQVWTQVRTQVRTQVSAKVLAQIFKLNRKVFKFFASFSVLKLHLRLPSPCEREHLIY